MAVRKHYTAALPATPVTEEWRARVKAVADHEQVNDSIASVVRDCIEAALPNFELALGILTLEDLTDEALEALGVQREAQVQPEDRTKGCFGAG